MHFALSLLGIRITNWGNTNKQVWGHKSFHCLCFVCYCSCQVLFEKVLSDWPQLMAKAKFIKEQREVEAAGELGWQHWHRVQGSHQGYGAAGQLGRPEAYVD